MPAGAPHRTKREDGLRHLAQLIAAAVEADLRAGGASTAGAAPPMPKPRPKGPPK